MKIFRFLGFKEKMLYEASIGRVYQHTKNRTIGMLTAFRGEFTLAENKKRNASLAASIRAAGFGYIKLYGNYVENYGMPTAKNVREESFLVISDIGNDNGKLKNFLIRAGRTWGQDSVLFKDGESDKAVLIGTKSGTFPGVGVEYVVGSWRANKMGEFYSKLKGKDGRTFTFECFKYAKTLFSKPYLNLVD